MNHPLLNSFDRIKHQKEVTKEISKIIQTSFDVPQQYIEYLDTLYPTLTRDDSLSDYPIDIESQPWVFFTRVLNEENSTSAEYLPEIVIAGGAARDWYIGNAARDIDIYVAAPERNWWKRFLFQNGELDGTSKVNLANLYKDTDFSREYHTNGQNGQTINPILGWLGHQFVINGLTAFSLIDKTCIDSKPDSPSYCSKHISFVFELKYKSEQFDIIFIDVTEPTLLHLNEKKSQELINQITKVPNFPKGFSVEKPSTDTPDWTKEETYNIVEVGADYICSKTILSFGEFVTSTYDIDICRAWYSLENDSLFVCESCRRDINNKTFTYYTGMSRNSIWSTLYRHLPKLQSKFIGFQLNPVIKKG